VRVTIPAAQRRPGRRTAVHSGLLTRLRQQGEDGMSLVEVIVSLSLVTVVMASAGLFFVNSLRTTGGQSQRQQAVNVANKQLESVQSLKPATLLNGRSSAAVTALLATPNASTLTSKDWTSSGNYDTASPLNALTVQPDFTMSPVNGIAYRVRTFIDLCSLQSDGSCIPGASEPSGDSKMYRATVDVSWAPPSNSGCASGCDYSISSLIDPHSDPTFNTNISHPTITSVSPGNSFGSGSVHNLVITGSGFVSGATLSIDTGGGSIAACSPCSNTGTQVGTYAYTAGAAGSYTLAVTNPDGGRATFSMTVTPAPSITLATPNSFNGNAARSITLSGSGFQTGAAVTASAGSAVSGLSITPPSSATFTYTGPASGGTVTFTMANSDGGTGTINVTVISAPTISFTSPSSVLRSSSNVALTLNGLNFQGPVTLSVPAGQGSFSGSPTVNGGGTAVTVNYNAPSTAQTVTITLRNADGGTATVPLVITGPPTITSVSPASVGGNGTMTLTLTGTGFQSGLSITSSAGSATNDTWVDSTHATVTFVAPATAGTVTLTLQNTDGGTATANVTVNPAPTITTNSWAAAKGSRPTLSLDGTGFQSGATVKVAKNGTTYFNNVATFNSATNLTFKLTTALPNNTNPFSVNVTVTNPDGGVVFATIPVTLS
jgi:type II secretory pathway pseudopilin PulG